MKDEKKAKRRPITYLWQRVLNVIGDPICILDLDGRILQCNKAMVNLLGKPVSEIVGRDCWELVLGSHQPI